MQNEVKIERHSAVRPKSYPTSNLINWTEGVVIKMNMDEDEALINAIDESGRERRFWEYTDNLILIE